LGPQGKQNCESPLPVKFKMTDDTQSFDLYIAINTAAHCSILLKFGTEFDQVTGHTLLMTRS